MARLQTSGPWWRGSEALNAAVTNCIKGYVGHTTMRRDVNWREPSIEAKSDHTTERTIRATHWQREVWCNMQRLGPGAHTEFHVLFLLLLTTLLFAFCFQADKDGIIEPLAGGTKLRLRLGRFANMP